jgi:hypothetical protein
MEATRMAPSRNASRMAMLGLTTRPASPRDPPHRVTGLMGLTGRIPAIRLTRRA